MADIRALLVSCELLYSGDPDVFHHRKGAPDPWRIRAEGLDRKLTDDEFAAALLHIGKHRGFKSNAKSERGQNALDDDKKMLGAIESNKELLAKYETLGVMVAREKKFGNRKRNRDGEYTHTFERSDLRDEVAKLFARQNKLGNPRATADLEERYVNIAFHQRPLQDSTHMVGFCPFEPGERRSPRLAPSFEKFRFLSKLNTVRVRNADGSLRRLSPEELRNAVEDFGVSSKSVTWNALAKKIGLPSTSAFDGIDEKRAKTDVAASGGCAAGTKTLVDALGPTGWQAVSRNPELLDAVAAVIAFREDIGSIETGFGEIEGLEPVIRNALMKSVSDGDFSTFKRAGHISAKAARNIVPHLLDGKVYSEACALAGYDHAQSRKIHIDDIRNAVVRRSLSEAVKQVETLIHHFEARPARIVVELARDVGKSVEERGRMTSGIDRRTKEKSRHRDELKEKLGLTRDLTEEELQRYELWKEQNYRCIYTDESISPSDILSSATQIDHILPRSRSQDNSYTNRVLCLAKANQDKKQRTPWEWLGGQGLESWDAFEARVRALKIKGMKKRNLLMRNFDERQRGFVERNLNDTRYATRALLTVLRELYVNEGDEPDPAAEGYLSRKRRLFARPGPVTAILRRAWGLDGLKDRADDRHHALDAIICAAGSNEWLLNSLTRQYQNIEEENRAKWIPRVPEPWPGFRDDVIRAYEGVFVCRTERRRGRGQGHAETIYSVGKQDGQKVTYERKAVADLTAKDIDRIKDRDGRNRVLAETLADWVGRGKPADDPPRSPKGDPVRKVSLQRNSVSGFELNGGHVDNADMVRVDVFAKPNKKGVDEFFLVPIYRHQVMDRRNWPEPPNRAMTRNKLESDWTKIDGAYEFQFSLYSDSLVEVVKQDGEIIQGYYRSADRTTGAISMSVHNLREPVKRGIGVKTLNAFRKFEADRLGRLHEIKRETRTWHGEVCT